MQTRGNAATGIDQEVSSCRRGRVRACFSAVRVRAMRGVARVGFTHASPETLLATGGRRAADSPASPPPRRAKCTVGIAAPPRPRPCQAANVRESPRGSGTSATPTSTQANGLVNPEGLSTTYLVQYGTSTSYGSSTRPSSAGQGSAYVAVSATLANLKSSTTYHYRIVATDAAGTTYGNDTAVATKASAQLSSYDQTVLSDHPVAFLDMAGTSTEPDITGDGHTGTYKGGGPALTTLPDGERAADFNTTGSHSGQYLTVPSSAAFSIPTAHQLTWEAWIRPDVLQFAHPASSDGYVDWMGKCQNYSPSCEWEARIYSAVTSQNRPDRLSAYVFNPSAGLGSAADWQPAAGVIAAGRWVQVVGEYQTLSTPSGCSTKYPGTINIWVDGVQQNFALHAPTGCMSQYSIKPKAGSSPLDIGTMGLDSWFQGAVGKVAIYDALLSPAQIGTHYLAMTGLPVSGTCALTCTIP